MSRQDTDQTQRQRTGEQDYAQDAYQINSDATVAGQPAVYDQVNPAQYAGIDNQTGQQVPGLAGPDASFPSPQSLLNQDVQTPALDYNGYVLYASARPVPEELIREPTGGSVAEPGAVLDEESGRTFVNHETGRYFLPNDPVCETQK